MNAFSGITSLIDRPSGISHENIPTPSWIGANTSPDVYVDVERLSKRDPFRITTEDHEALFHMPKGKVGVVIGSGPNTPQWKEKGWYTLDIDAAHFNNESLSTLPDRDNYAELMREYGFQPIIELTSAHYYKESGYEQHVVYHGIKMAEGFKPLH